MPPKRAPGMYSDYVPQIKQRCTWESYPTSPAMGMGGAETWYNTVYPDDAYDPTYYASGDGMYGEEVGGMYNGSYIRGKTRGGYTGRVGNHADGMDYSGNLVGSYGSGWMGVGATGYQEPYGSKQGKQKSFEKPVGDMNESVYVNDFAIVKESEKHFKQTGVKRYVNSYSEFKMTGRSQFTGMEEWEEGGMGYNEGWVNFSQGGRGKFRRSQDVIQRGKVVKCPGVVQGTYQGGWGTHAGFPSGRGMQVSVRGGRGFVRGFQRGKDQISSRGGFTRGQSRGQKQGLMTGTFSKVIGRGSKMAVTNPVTNLSLPQKIHHFCVYCINDEDKINEIQTIENALTASKLGLKSEYTVVDLNGKMFSGALFLDGVFIARSANSKKKQAKHDCYAKALKVLRTMTVPQIMALKDEGPEFVMPDETSDIETKALMEALQSTDSFQGSSMPNSAVPGLHKLMQHLKNRQSAHDLVQSPLQELEQAFPASHCSLSHSFEVDSIQVEGKSMFRARLLIEGILFAGALASQKKKAKQKVAEQAVKFLLTQTIGHLVRGKSLKELDIEESTVDASKSTSLDSSTQMKPMTEKERLEKLISRVKPSRESKNPMTTLTKLTSKFGIPVNTIFRSSDDNNKIIECKLFVSGFLLSIGEGETTQESRQDAYIKAFEILNEQNVDELMKNCRRISKVDTQDPKNMEMTVKSKKKKMEDSNLTRLKRIANFDKDESLKINISEMIIMEHSDWAADRKRSAFCILSESALQNHMLLEWNISQNNKLFTCTMSLQKIVLSEVSAVNKSAARSLAAGAVLFRLYETLPVVMTMSKYLKEAWITYEDLCKKAQKLKEENGETGSIDNDMVKIDSFEDVICREKAEVTDCEEGNAVDIEGGDREDNQGGTAMDTVGGSVIKTEESHAVDKAWNTVDSKGGSNVDTERRNVMDNEGGITTNTEGERDDLKSEPAVTNNVTDKSINTNETNTEIKNQNLDKTVNVSSDKINKEISDAVKTENGNTTENRKWKLSGDLNAGRRRFHNLCYNKWVMKYVEQLIKEYAEGDAIDELIFGSDIPLGDLKQITTLSRQYGLKFGRRSFQGQIYSSISKRLSPRSIYNLLVKGVSSKRYCLVPLSELPCYKDIQHDIVEASKVQDV